MPPDFTLADAAAALFIVIAWTSQSLILRSFASGSINTHLNDVRIQWFKSASQRDGSPFDSLLFGHLVHAVAFFGSATLLVLAGLITMIANLPLTYETVSKLPFIANVSSEMFAIKVLFVTAIITASFFTFTYALRKMIYGIALLGALPGTSDGHPNRDELVESLAIVMGESVKSFNFGIRGYYYAAAALALFVSPLACLITTLFVAAVLLYRQVGTKTKKAVQRYVSALMKE